MKLRVQDIRNQFNIFIYSLDVNTFNDIRLHLSQSGYNCLSFSDPSTLMDRLKLDPPHVLIFSLQSLQGPLSEFIKKVLEINNEIQLVAVGEDFEREPLFKYSHLNVVDYINLSAHMNTVSLWTVDNIVRRLVQNYANEDLDLKNQELQKAIEILKAKPPVVVEKVIQQANPKPVASHTSVDLLFLKKAKSRDELFRLYFKWLSQFTHLNLLYFKYIPSAHAVMMQYCIGLDQQKLDGLGCELNPKDQLKDPQSLRELIRQALGQASLQVAPLVLQNEIQGYFVYWGQQQNIAADVFELYYENLIYKNKVTELSILDPVTQLLSAKVFFEKIEEEVARSRRIKLPVSLILMKLDSSQEVIQNVGETSFDLLLKSIAKIVKKGSRVNDLVFRINEDEFALLLPHCARKGAAVRAERLRKMIESGSFALAHLKITFSFGVTEFPTLCHSAEDLMKTANTALNFVVKKGGNKVCLFKAKDNFKPEFDIKLPQAE